MVPPFLFVASSGLQVCRIVGSVLGRGSGVAPKAVLCRLYLAFVDGGKNGAQRTHATPRPLSAAFSPLAAERGRPQKRKIRNDYMAGVCCSTKSISEWMTLI